MSDSLIQTKAKAFAIRVVKLHKYLRGKREATMSKQAIALKGAGETLYWLELLRDVELIPDNDAYKTICADCEELIRLLVASLKKLKPIEINDGAQPYDRIARAEAEIDAGKGIDARESLRRTRARLHG